MFRIQSSGSVWYCLVYTVFFGLISFAASPAAFFSFETFGRVSSGTAAFFAVVLAGFFPAAGFFPSLISEVSAAAFFLHSGVFFCFRTTPANGGSFSIMAFGRYIHSSSSSSMISAFTPLPPYFSSSEFRITSQFVPSFTPIL